MHRCVVDVAANRLDHGLCDPNCAGGFFYRRVATQGRLGRQDIALEGRVDDSLIGGNGERHCLGENDAADGLEILTEYQIVQLNVHLVKFHFG